VKVSATVFLAVILHAMDREKTKRRIIGSVYIAGGIVVILFSVGILPLQRLNLSGPVWLFAAFGAMLIMLSLALSFRLYGVFYNFFVGCSCVLTALPFLWVALWSTPGSISGGIPFLPAKVNQMLGRWVFVLMAFALGLVGLSAFKHAFRLSRSKRERGKTLE
jgi:hypothetical protein